MQGSWLCAIKRLHKREKATWRSRLKSRLCAREKAVRDEKVMCKEVNCTQGYRLYAIQIYNRTLV